MEYSLPHVSLPEVEAFQRYLRERREEIASFSLRLRPKYISVTRDTLYSTAIVLANVSPFS